MWILQVYGVYLAVMSVITFVLYAVDKSRAQGGMWRIPEATLLGFSFLGGALGGTVAMRVCHHKTKHGIFHLVNSIGLIWQVALLVFLMVKYAV